MSPVRNGARQGVLGSMNSVHGGQPLDKEVEAAQRETSGYKFQIYKNSTSYSWASMEVGKGDTWEEAFAAVESEHGKCVQAIADGKRGPAREPARDDLPF